MLSRSNSNAAERLRRAKSTSSAHTTTSGHQRSSTSIDPFVIRQHAETAAVEAFQRAKQFEEPATLQAYRPVPPKLHRRRSQATGRTEGSHFEDARLGRTRSTSKRDENRGLQAARSQFAPSEAPTSEASEGEVVITRKRTVIPPTSAPRYPLYDASSTTASSRNERRKSWATYTDGSPVPRNAPAAQRSSAANPSMPLSYRPQCENYFAGAGDSERAAQSSKPSIRETQTDEEILALAQDHCPQGSQSKKLRERISFLLPPFQRRPATDSPKGSEHSYDTVLPPFNYADGGLPPPPPPPPVYTAPAFTVNGEMKTSRNFSDSLKGRFKKVFRKATKLPTIIPAQHVEATHLHFPVTTPLSTPTVQPEEQEDPFTSGTGNDSSYLTVPNPYAVTESRHSSGEQSATKSRVTSWTTSTVAGTWSTCDDAENHDTADEQGRLKRSDSISTLKKASSFFGRPVKNKLRRGSKLDLSGSQESAGLFSALQEHIQPADTASQVAVCDTETQSVRVPSALDSLPSRQNTESSISSRSGWQAATIRSVTPDSTAYRLDIPSPVAEVLSPEAARPHSPQDDSHDELTPRSQLRRRPAMKAPMPSKEQIERRMERCKNRWQSPLDELSPSAPRPSRHTLEEYPYEMRSLSRTLQQPLANDLPHHARIGEQQLGFGRPDVLSPSVYSRGTDGDSPRPDTPAAQGGMVVKITGREVKSYAISPSKIEQPVERAIHASQEWRRWLSDEMNGWDGFSAPQDFALPKTVLKDTSSGNEHGIAQMKPSDQRVSSASPVIEPPQIQIRTKDHRQRASSRLSGYMNDRYPMIDTGRNSSDQSIGRRSRISSRVESRTGTSGSSARPPLGQERKSSAEGKSLKSVLACQRVVTKPRSMAQMTTSVGVEAPARNVGNEGSAVAVPAKADIEPASKDVDSKPSAPARRPKSAFDLRANCKSRISSAARPLEVRRKAHDSDHCNMLEDSTILNISAGPYASSPHDANKENVAPHSASEPAAALPALSSSEWLAAGTSKKREVQGLNAIHPAYRKRSDSRYSPLRSRTGTPTSGLGGGGSPGHRLASSWLDGKKSKENSLAFV